LLARGEVMNLQDIRNKLDRIDFQILKLLDSRMEFSLKTKKLKKSVEDPSREEQLLRRIREHSQGLIAPDFCEKLFTQIISESKKLQEKEYSLIGFQGEHGAYSEVAAREWNEDLIPIPCTEFFEVFDGVDSGVYDFGIVPVENSLGGVISQVNRLIINTELHVVGAVELTIHHCLLTFSGIDYREIHTVYSHSQALEQCHQFIERNKLEPVPYYDTAGSAKMLVETEPKSSAAIASKLAAELYNLEIIKENIEDFDRNITRFLVFSKNENKDNGEKCSIIFSTAHKAGILFQVLKIFADAQLNLSRIESMPNQRGSYAFFLDFIGSKDDKSVISALQKVQKITTNFRFLGCYKEIKVI
jgi:prephenate dehydratase/chorismate mutase